jgi:hypothetical protein
MPSRGPGDVTPRTLLTTQASPGRQSWCPNGSARATKVPLSAFPLCARFALALLSETHNLCTRCSSDVSANTSLRH